MRPIELVSLIALAIVLVIYAIPWSRQPPSLRFTPVLSTIIILVHIVFEGYRWQMVPAYIVSGVVLLAGIPTIIRQNRVIQKSNWIIKTWKIIGSLIGLSNIMVCC